MQWWEWVIWVLAVFTGMSGLVLGVRAELRSTHYSTLWVIKAGNPVKVFNRTGEDATDVRLKVVRGALVGARSQYAHVEKDAAISAPIRPDSANMFAIELEWTRPTNGKRYRLGESWWARQSRWRRLGRGRVTVEDLFN